MKLFIKSALFALLIATSSCAFFFNDKEVDLSINSNPPGADIFIEGKSYGKTPATIHIEPKTYDIVLTKEGYGSTQFKVTWWQTLRDKKKVRAEDVWLTVSEPCWFFPHFLLPRSIAAISKRSNIL